MNLADELKAATKIAEGGGRYCSVCDALGYLNRDQVESLRKALASPLGAVKLSKILQKNGVAVGVPSIRAHRSEGHTP